MFAIERGIEDTGIEVVLTSVIKDEELELKISSSSNNHCWLILEDINNEDDSEGYVAIPKSIEGIDKTIKLLEKAKQKFFK